MQAVSDYIDLLDDPQREIMAFLHELLLSASPEIRATIRYKIPFYDHHSWVCYLNPLKGGGVELVFIHGQELSNAQGLLDARGRKQVMGVVYTEVRHIQPETLTEVLWEALLLDQEKSRHRRTPA